METAFAVSPSAPSPSASSPTQKRTPARWAGSALIAIASIHTAVGLLAGLRWIPDPQMDRFAGNRVPLLELQPGFALAENVDLLALTVFWFLFFGFALLPLGFLLRYLEKNALPVPRSIGIQLMLLAGAGAVLLPASGFWLALLPAWNILRTQ